MSEKSFDLVVIGGGPGGYVAAIRASQLGLKVACIESRGTLGGTCLNVGCIPSKALLESSDFFWKTSQHAEEFGVSVKDVRADIKFMLERKNKIVTKLTQGIEGLFKKNKVTYFKGRGQFVNAQQIKVLSSDGKEEEISSKKTIIATGSSPIELPFAKFDGTTVVSSTEALDFESAPKHLVVIGGGVIGLELGSVWQRLGSQVTVIEAAPEILAPMDVDVRKTMTRILNSQGLVFKTGAKVSSVEVKGKGRAIVSYESGGEATSIEANKVLVAVGRRAFTAGLGLENIGLGLEQGGKIAVDDDFQTKIKGVYAIGDVIDGPMLAHKAEDEGVVVAEKIMGQKPHINKAAIPNVIYTQPEVASVGLSEDQCKAEGREIKIGKFPFSANGRAACHGDSNGFVKLIADAKTDKLIGGHIVSSHASELIAELAIGMEFHTSAEDIARSTHAHPTLAEAIKEAALAVDKRTIHM